MKTESNSSLLRRASEVYVTVTGVHDTAYLKITKKQAKEVLRTFGNQMMVVLHEGAAYIDQNHDA